MKPIRKQYEKLGVSEFYRQHGHEYVNPHVEQIQSLLSQNQSKIDYTHSLDLCCGGGEASMILRELGYDAEAIDPFTGDAYERNLQRPCASLTFDDIVRGELDNNHDANGFKGLNPPWSSVICSFAMHLVEPKDLFMIAYQLFLHTEQLVIITPHKRPALESFEEFDLEFEDFALTHRGKKVRLKSYVVHGRESIV